MLRLSAKIIINSEKQWILTKVNNVEIELDIDKLTSTGSITLPKNAKWQDEPKIPIKRGDKVTVELGYDDKLEVALVGYVVKVNIKTPVVIECEDSMFLLKQQNCKPKTYINPDLKKILQEQIGSSVRVEVVGKVALGGKLVVQNVTVAALLDTLKEKAGVKSYFTYKNGQPTLNVGYVFTQNAAGKLFKYNSHKNIVSYSDLKQNSKEDRKIKVVANGTTIKGKKIKVQVGDKDGEKRTLTKINTTQEALEQEANELLNKLKVDGLSGGFTVFGGNLVGILDSVELILDGENKGKYQIGKNKITYGTGGFRQELTMNG